MEKVTQQILPVFVDVNLACGQCSYILFFIAKYRLIKVIKIRKRWNATKVTYKVRNIDRS